MENNSLTHTCVDREGYGKISFSEEKKNILVSNKPCFK